MIEKCSLLYGRIIVFFVLLPVLLVSCSSNKVIPAEPLNYTDYDVRLNEISQIEEIFEQKPVEALWRAYLVKNAVPETETSTLEMAFFDKCVQSVKDLYNRAIDDKEYLTAIRLYKSLKAVEVNDMGDSSATKDSSNVSEQVGDNVEESLLKSLSDQLFDGVSENTDIENSDIKVSSYIKGTVTVWLDLGVKVEKGVGYADRVIGSGFFIDKRGYIVTNYHVISTEVDPTYEGYSRVYIKLADDNETRIPARVVGWDSALDLALLKTEVDAPYVFSLGSSADLDVGDRIYAIGSPIGLEKTLTSGIVSADDRKLFSVGSVMQIDAAVNSGNSGGPIIDSNGLVQAIVFAGILQYDSLNFAIPVEYLKYDLLRMYNGGEVKHPWLGAFGTTKKDATIGNVPCGVEVQYVMPGSSAFRSSIEKGDVITAVNGLPVTTIEVLKDILLQLPVDLIASFQILKNNGQVEVIPVYLDERPEYPGYEVFNHDIQSRAFYPIFGMELIPVDTKDSKKYSISAIVKGGIADESGFSLNDPIEIEKTKVTNDKSVIYAEIYTKKQKSGYLDVNLAISAPLDSSNYF